MSCDCELGVKLAFGKPPVLMCKPIGLLQGRTASSKLQRIKGYAQQSVRVLLQALPYTLHATIDGALLGSADSPLMLASLTFSVALCSVQDVGTIILSLSSTELPKELTQQRAVLATTLCFGIGFPLGTIVTLSLNTLPLIHVRAFAGGLFLFIALFELAPPHPCGRLSSLRFLVAFASGLIIAHLSETGESLIRDVTLEAAHDTMAWVVTTHMSAHRASGPSSAGNPAATLLPTGLTAG